MVPQLLAQTTPVGHYRCHGTQGQQPYDIELDVTAYGQTYELAWVSADQGLPALIGLGILQDGKLAVAIVSPKGGVGVALYTVAPGRLNGVWTRGDMTMDTESCIQGRPA